MLQLLFTWSIRFNALHWSWSARSSLIFQVQKTNLFPQVMLLFPISSLWAAEELGIVHIPIIIGWRISLTGFAKWMCSPQSGGTSRCWIFLIWIENSCTLMLYLLSVWGEGQRRQHLPLFVALVPEDDSVLNSHHEKLLKGKDLFWYSFLS